MLEVLEAGKAGGFPEAKGFFKMVLEDTYEGMFSDPEYGGNRDYAGWKLVGYPGAQRAYTAHELRNGPQHKRVQGLRDMPPMNPGVPQDHVILPIAGTRPQTNGIGLAMAIQHKKVDMVTIGAGWTAGMLAAKLCPNGTEVVSLEQGAPRWTWPHFAHDHDSLRYSVRYALMVDLQTGDLDLAAEPEVTGATDAPIRHLQPRHGPRRRGRSLVSPTVALPRVRLQTPLAHRRAIRRKQDPGRVHRPGLGNHLPGARALLRRFRMGHRRLGATRKPEREDHPGRQPVRVAALAAATRTLR